MKQHDKTRAARNHVDGKRLAIAVFAAVAIFPALAHEHHEGGTRELGAHEHGVGRLGIAVEGERIAIELEAPGADIVGFEHAAERPEDRAALERAIAILEKPLDLFLLPEEAKCTVTEASAKLTGEEEHDHDAHAGQDHDDKEHGNKEHEKKGHEDHAHAHDHEAGHSEFRAAYVLTCANPAAITQIDFAYFKTFPNARELDIELISQKGAKGFEVERDTPVLDLKGQL